MTVKACKNCKYYALRKYAARIYPRGDCTYGGLGVPIYLDGSCNKFAPKKEV